MGACLGACVGATSLASAQASNTGDTDATSAVSDEAATGTMTLPVRYVHLGSRSLPRSVSEPGVYVQLYRPSGALDYGAPLPYHLTIYNNLDLTLSAWQLSFAFDGAIDHAWNAEIVSQDERYLALPESWNGALAPGAVRQFGFVGRAFDRAKPRPNETSYLLHAELVAAASDETTPPSSTTDHESCQLEVEFVVQLDGQFWAERQHSFFGEFYLRNVGDQPTNWALQWSMDRSRSHHNGPGTRSINTWQRLEGGAYYLLGSSHEGPIEPGGTRSIGIWGDYATLPHDLVACPRNVRLAPDPAAEAYRAAFDALDDEEKRAVACGSLVWNGVSFSIPSPLSGMGPACPRAPDSPTAP